MKPLSFSEKHTLWFHYDVSAEVIEDAEQLTARSQAQATAGSEMERDMEPTTVAQ